MTRWRVKREEKEKVTNDTKVSDVASSFELPSITIIFLFQLSRIKIDCWEYSVTSLVIPFYRNF